MGNLGRGIALSYGVYPYFRGDDFRLCFSSRPKTKNMTQLNQHGFDGSRNLADFHLDGMLLMIVAEGESVSGE